MAQKHPALSNSSMELHSLENSKIKVFMDKEDLYSPMEN
jgi:hypothetical protein